MRVTMVHTEMLSQYMASPPPRREKTLWGAVVLRLMPVRPSVLTRLTVATADVGATVVRTVLAVVAAATPTFGPRRLRAGPGLCEAAIVEVKRPWVPPSLPDVASVSDRRSMTVPPPPALPPPARPTPREGGRTCRRTTGLVGLEELLSRMTRLGLGAAARTAWYGDGSRFVASTVLGGASASSSSSAVLGPRRWNTVFTAAAPALEDSDVSVLLLTVLSPRRSKTDRLPPPGPPANTPAKGAHGTTLNLPVP